jgi:hypothetical protein
MTTNHISRITSTAMQASNQLPNLISIVLIVFCIGIGFQAKGQQYPKPLTQGQLYEENRQLQRDQEARKRFEDEKRAKSQAEAKKFYEDNERRKAGNQLWNEIYNKNSHVASSTYESMKFVLQDDYYSANVKTGYKIDYNGPYYNSSGIYLGVLKGSGWDVYRIDKFNTSTVGFHYGSHIEFVSKTDIVPYLKDTSTFTQKEAFDAMAMLLKGEKTLSVIDKEKKEKEIELRNNAPLIIASEGARVNFTKGYAGGSTYRTQGIKLFINTRDSIFVVDAPYNLLSVGEIYVINLKNNVLNETGTYFMQYKLPSTKNSNDRLLQIEDEVHKKLGLETYAERTAREKAEEKQRLANLSPSEKMLLDATRLAGNIQNFGKITFMKEYDRKNVLAGYLFKNLNTGDSVKQSYALVSNFDPKGNVLYDLYKLEIYFTANYNFKTITVNQGALFKTFTPQQLQLNAQKTPEIPLTVLTKIEANIKGLLKKERDSVNAFFKNEEVLRQKRYQTWKKFLAAAPYTQVDFYVIKDKLQQFPWETYEFHNGYKLDVKFEGANIVVREVKYINGSNSSLNIYFSRTDYDFNYLTAISNTQLGLAGGESTIEILKKINKKLEEKYNGNFLLDFTGRKWRKGDDQWNFWGVKEEKNGDYYYGQFYLSPSKLDPVYFVGGSLTKHADGRKTISISGSLKLIIERNGDMNFNNGNTLLTADGRIIINGTDYTNELKKIRESAAQKKKDSRGYKSFGDTENGAGVIWQELDKTIIAGIFSNKDSKKTVTGLLQLENGDTFFGDWDLGVLGYAILVRKSGEIIVGPFTSSSMTKVSETVIYYTNGDVIQIPTGLYIDNYGKIIFNGECTAIDWAAKETYKGMYSQGLRNGSGIIYYTDGTSKKAIYKNGVLQ